MKIRPLLGATAITALAIPLCLSAPSAYAAEPATTVPHIGIGTDCPSEGQESNGVVCTSLTNGVLWGLAGRRDADPIGVDKASGSATTAELGYEFAGVNHYKTPMVSTAAGTSHDATWSAPSSCGPVPGPLNTSTKDTYQRPTVDNC